MTQTLKCVVVFLSLLCVSLIPQKALSQEQFTVSDIRVEGLQRIAAGTVFNYLPIRIGDTVGAQDVQQGIKALFGTGFFKDVLVDRDGDVLIVRVIERPSLGQIDIIGNKEFKRDELITSLDQIGMATGRVFNQSLLDRVERELREQYLSRGYYNLTLKSTITPLERNRVALTINLEEGEIARIQEINFVGNETFSDKALLRQMEQRTDSRTRFWSKRDRYSKPKLEADLESIRSYYQNRGYLDFKIDSAQVSVTPDKSSIFITIAVMEGGRFKVGDVQLSGETVKPPEELEQVVTLSPGNVFSRKDVSETRIAIQDQLADAGYAFANVNALPEVDETSKEVDFDFIIDPGRRVYVRRINITGNTTTRDEVIRRELRQLEGGWYSESKLQRSRERLLKLGYFDDVQIDTPAVAGTIDQIDINLEVKERATGSFLFGVGYSEAEGILLQANVNQRNLFGTGKELLIGIDNSQVTDVYEIKYKNPYYTIDGVSRGFNLTRRTVDAAEANTAEYISETWDLGVDYRIPLSEFNSLNIGAAYERVDLGRTDETPPEFDAVISRFPTTDNFKIDLSLVRDTRDQFFFPNDGGFQRLALEATVPGSELEYYKLSLRGAWYKALSKRFTFKVGGELGYGDGYGDAEILPFYENFFAGGPSTVRGYKPRSLGPVDSGDTPEQIGGSSRILANMELIFPVPGLGISSDKRLSLFFDAGQVFGDSEDRDLNELRLSAGLAFSWFSPIGPLSISYGIPIGKEPGDEEQRLQFTLGTSFR